MSYFYKYEFVSPESVFATVKEEFKSYFDTGAVDDLLFPTYLDKCLKKLGRATYTITPVILDVCDFEARLPEHSFHRQQYLLLYRLALPQQIKQILVIPLDVLM
jgi:hypothetical protein